MQNVKSKIIDSLKYAKVKIQNLKAKIVKSLKTPFTFYIFFRCYNRFPYDS
jgi:hypothetical protein